LISSHVNHIWSKLLVEELTRCGIARFCISPGSRNSPLVLAVGNNERAESIVHFDERGAAFHALGYANATGKPAALICTSGTALANYYPAIVESSMSGTPLLILSADRPVELRDCRSPQAIDQVNIFGEYLRWFFDLLCPYEKITPAFLLTTVDQAVHRATGSHPGPVQLNCQFREPLAPAAKEYDFTKYLEPVKQWITSDTAYTTYHAGPQTVNKDTVSSVAARLKSAKSGMIIAGPMPAHEDHDSIVGLADKLGWPLMADVASGLRFDSRASSVISHYDLFLRDMAFTAMNPVDMVLHFGGQPTCKYLQLCVERDRPHVILVNDHPDRQDPSHMVNDRVMANPRLFASALTESVGSITSILAGSFKYADKLGCAAVKEFVNRDGQITELATAYWTASMAPEGSGLFLASSMPIRDVDAVACRSQKRLHVGVNRGANGIDGTVASGAGFASGLRSRTTVLLGDLALLHDLNSLALVKRSEVPITLIVINNNGGGIFSYLPIAKVESHFENLFAAPHNLDFENVARMFSLRYRRVTQIGEFKEAYTASQAEPTSSIIEVVSDRKRNVEEHKSLWDSLRKVIPED
jgi:2-succinyl-5-enolpyruvyl-6-hydroxy-3-cyclohexene-1-carboxylate synthase